MSTINHITRFTLGLGALVLGGCLVADHGADPAAEGDANTLPISAYVDKPGAWFGYACCGLSPAFSSLSSNTGWALDPSQPDGNGNYRVSRWSNGVKTPISGYFRKLDIVGNTELWALDHNGSVYRNTDLYSSNGGSWRHICACQAFELGAGANGTVVIVGLGWQKQFNRNSGGFVDIFPHPQGLNSVDVDNNGDIYGLLRYDRKIYRLRPPYNTPWLEYNFPGEPMMHNIVVGKGKVFLQSFEGGNGDGLRTYQWTPGSSVIYRDNSGVGLSKLHVTAGGKLWGSTNSGYMLWSNLTY